MEWMQGYLMWYLYNDGYAVARFKSTTKEVQMYDFMLVHYLGSSLTDGEIMADAQKIAEELDL
jgi:hypothetical protein